jgi:hypothetical protein
MSLAQSSEAVLPRPNLFLEIPSSPLPSERRSSPSSEATVPSSGSQARYQVVNGGENRLTPASLTLSLSGASPNSEASLANSQHAQLSASITIALPDEAISKLAESVTEALGGRGFHQGIYRAPSMHLKPPLSPLATAAVEEVYRYNQQQPGQDSITKEQLSQGALLVAVQAYEGSRRSPDGATSTLYATVPTGQITNLVAKKSSERICRASQELPGALGGESADGVIPAPTALNEGAPGASLVQTAQQELAPLPDAQLQVASVSSAQVGGAPVVQISAPAMDRVEVIVGSGFCVPPVPIPRPVAHSGLDRTAQQVDKAAPASQNAFIQGSPPARKSCCATWCIIL